VACILINKGYAEIIDPSNVELMHKRFPRTSHQCAIVTALVKLTLVGVGGSSL